MAAPALADPAALRELVTANRILAHEGVLDAFGHVSLRHPADPRRYLLPRSRSPQLVEPADVLEYTLDSEPVKPSAEWAAPNTTSISKPLWRKKSIPM